MVPTCSVVIPTFRRPWLLRRCLRALAQQSLAPSSFEVIVADDDANDRLRHILERFSRRLPYSLVYVPVADTQGPAAARNAGIRRACGEVVAFTDDDTIPDRHWLKNALVAFDSHLDAAWGKIVVPISSHPTDYEKNVSRLESAGFVTANAFCRRSLLLEVGGFDALFTRAWLEDSDLYFRLLKHKALRVRFLPQAIVIHPVRKAPWGASIRQQANNFFNPLLYKKHPRKYRETIQPYPPFLYYGIVGCMALAIMGLLTHRNGITSLCLFLWITLTSVFVGKRLKETRRDGAHICEMIITSIAIPPLAIYWRLRGALHWHVAFL